MELESMWWGDQAGFEAQVEEFWAARGTSSPQSTV